MMPVQNWALEALSVHFRSHGGQANPQKTQPPTPSLRRTGGWTAPSPRAVHGGRYSGAAERNNQAKKQKTRTGRNEDEMEGGEGAKERGNGGTERNDGTEDNDNANDNRRGTQQGRNDGTRTLDRGRDGGIERNDAKHNDGKIELKTMRGRRDDKLERREGR